MIHAWGQYRGLLRSAHPVTLTFSVTARCQSRCLTCHIGEYYQQELRCSRKDLTCDEIRRIFQSLGTVYFFNISGGEPFLRPDLAQIVELAVEYLQPAIIHIPTNALTPQRIENTCRQILDNNRRRRRPVPLTVKPSIDGIGKLHDTIRGVPGNFQKLEETIIRLKMVEENYPEFHLELGTVISKYNIDHLEEIEDYVHALGVQSYRNEIAEERAEFFNKGDGITPGVEMYSRVLQRFSEQIMRHLREKRPMTRWMEVLRLVYYELAVEILRRKTQVIPCYGGISNLHLNFDGELWPCCVLAYDKPLGDLRRNDYDVQKVIRSKQARDVLQFIKHRGCYCPLANQWYSNILLSPKMLLRVIAKNFSVD